MKVSKDTKNIIALFIFIHIFQRGGGLKDHRIVLYRPVSRGHFTLCQLQIEIVKTSLPCFVRGLEYLIVTVIFQQKINVMRVDFFSSFERKCTFHCHAQRLPLTSFVKIVNLFIKNCHKGTPIRISLSDIHVCPSVLVLALFACCPLVTIWFLADKVMLGHLCDLTANLQKF